MIDQYLTWIVDFLRTCIAELNGLMLTSDVSLLGFIGAAAVLCIIIGRILIR